MAAPRIRKPSKPKAEKTLTHELSALLEKVFLPDLAVRARQPAIERALRQQWEAERAARHTAADFEPWVAATVEQVGAAWILSCVFVRVLEDRGLLDRRRIAGEGAEDSVQQFLEIAPALTERDYLLTVFRELATYPGAADVLDPAHNPAWRLAPSNDSVRALLTLLRAPDAQDESGLRLRFRFGRDDTPDTRFLGDLYQDLSEGVRKRYALLQTPDFVERFILDHTLEPAIAEFGLETVRLIDPTCGSGHFLLGAFHRLFEHRLRKAPAVDRREHARQALDQVTGVDINPYAVAIARFRLTLAYLEHAGIDRLALAPRIASNVVVADSLLHGSGQARLSEQTGDVAAWGDQLFTLDDPAGARRVFGRRYHAVVGNPPYITCKDSAQREEYRKLYASCHREFALGAPFTERFFQLAEPGGFVGLINSNSFTKREFGTALIEKVLKNVDLTEVIDTSGAYIPGHGTPTIILFGRNRTPLAGTVLASMGKRGEPTTPEDAERGLVWSSIAAHHSDVGFENEYISVTNVQRTTFGKHPWSLGGGGAVDLKLSLESAAPFRLQDLAELPIGRAARTGMDDVMAVPASSAERFRIPSSLWRGFVTGESIRDWSTSTDLCVLFPYDESNGYSRYTAPGETVTVLTQFLWPYRTVLSERATFQGKMADAGREWWEYMQYTKSANQTPLSIAFAFVATHNHFVLDRGGKVFKQSAPIIKLPPTKTEDDHLALLAYLNSSTACFWMKQVFYPKGSSSGDVSVEKGKPENNRYEFAGTGLASMPIPALPDGLIALAREMESLALRRAGLEAAAALRRAVGEGTDLRAAVHSSEQESEDILLRMVAVQEDIDWIVYSLLGLAGEDTAKSWSAPVRLAKNDRSFAVEAPPSYLSNRDAELWQARKTAIASSPELALIETAVNKRRWWGARGVFASKVTTYAERAIDAAKVLLAEWAEEQLRGEAHPLRLKDLAARATPQIRQVADLITTDDPSGVLMEAIGPESVPYLESLTYSADGLKKRASWQRTWEQQRAEDRGEPVGAPPVPGKYDPDDFQHFSYWSNRGKLDVPKERFISYPGLERDDDKSPLVGWAGWDHLQRAQALAAIFQERKEHDGWPRERLLPILAGLLELVPWLKQWHNAPDPTYDGQRMGDVYEAFVSEKARGLQATLDELRAWRPADSRAGNGRGRAKSASIISKKAAATEADEPSEEPVNS